MPTNADVDGSVTIFPIERHQREVTGGKGAAPDEQD